MTEEIKKTEAIEEIEQDVVSEASANPQASAPTKNAVAAEPSHLKGDYEDLGAPVVKPTDSNPDATKKSTQAKDQVNAKAKPAELETPDTEKGVTKVSTPGQKETVKAQKDHEKINADKEMLDATYGEEVEIDVSADVDALVKDEGLSEEFKSKTATIFEAAVKRKITEARERLNAEFDKKLNEEVESHKEKLSEKVDTYLTYVVEEWMKENSIAIERGIKGEIAEDFITGLKKLFEDHYIDVPDEKYNVLEDQSNKIANLEEQLNKEIQKNAEFVKENSKYKRSDIINEVASDLAETQKEEFGKLSEEVEYSNEEEFKSKLTTIKEAYFGKKESTGDIDDVTAGDTQDLSPELNNAMAAYSAAISKTKGISLSKKTI